MIEYFVFILMIIAGVAIIAFAVDKKRRKGKKAYAGISSKGTVKRGGVPSYKSNTGRNRYAPDPDNPDKRYDSLFSGKKEDSKDRYKKIMERRKNIRPGEIEIPVNAWGTDSGDKKASKKSQASAQNGKYGHLFSSDSSASTSKLAKLKMRAMEVYEEQYNKDDSTPDKEEKASIFSMFGGGNAEENSPPTPPPVQSSFEPEMRREDMQPLPERERVPEPAPSGFGSFGRPEPEVNSSSPVPPAQDNDVSRPPEPQPRDDSAAKDDAFNRMLGFEAKKEEPPKKKNDNEWTPMF